MTTAKIVNTDIRNIIGPGWRVYAPDGAWYGSIPYIIGYLGCAIAYSLGDLDAAPGVLFSWTHAWQSIGWTKRLDKPVLIGGKHAQLLGRRDMLPNIPNVSYYLQHIDAAEHGLETRVTPNFQPCLQANPYCDWLMVHSGEGCSWGHCSFCTVHDGEQYMQFDPQYVARVVMLANSYGKAAGLSANVHTLEWLEKLEAYLPSGRRYDAYVRGDRTDWSRLTKARKLFIGSEYLSDAVLHRVRKGLTSNQIMEAIIAAQRSGIDVESIAIIDLWQTDEERAEHYANTMELLRNTKRAGLGAGIFSFIVTRYSERGKTLYANMD